MDADEESIRHAFRVLAKSHHPDAGAGASAEKFHRIFEAYETLRDPARRAVYDKSLRARSRSTMRSGGEPPPPEPTRAEPLRPDFSFSGDIIEQLFDELFRDLQDYPFLGRPFPR